MARPAAYSAWQKFAHWATLLLILILFGLAWSEDLFPRGPARDRLWWLHVSFGLLLAALLVARLATRLLRGAPSPPTSSRAERLAAAATHGLLYVLPALTILVGMVLAGRRSLPLSFFDLFAFPALAAPADRTAIRLAQNFHEWTAYLVLLLAGGHALVALWHHYVRRDGVMERMLPGRR